VEKAEKGWGKKKQASHFRYPGNQSVERRKGGDGFLSPRGEGEGKRKKKELRDASERGGGEMRLSSFFIEKRSGDMGEKR